MRGSDRMGSIDVKRPQRAKKTRAQKSVEARAALFQAAAEIVGEYGYADASITRITQRANLAQGTFYNYFASRQEIFDELLPVLGAQMMEHIRHRAVGGKTFLEREELAFRAFFSYLKRAPYFLRILNEAEMAAPRAFRQHLANMSTGYVRFLQKAREQQQIADVRRLRRSDTFLWPRAAIWRCAMQSPAMFPSTSYARTCDWSRAACAGNRPQRAPIASRRAPTRTMTSRRASPFARVVRSLIIATGCNRRHVRSARRPP